MSTDYTTYQQHEPLRAPTGWSTQEKRFVAQLEELFDDIYRRYNRLRLEDMSTDFRKSYSKIIADGTEMRTDINATAAGLSAEITRASIAEGALSNTINATASAMELTFKKIGASGYTATGITTIGENGITVSHSSLNCKTEMSASGFRILRNSDNALLGGLMSLDNEIVLAMNVLYSINFPSFKLGLNRMTSSLFEGESMDGIALFYNNVTRLGIGMAYDDVTKVIKGERIIASDGFDIISDGKNISLLNGNTRLLLESPVGQFAGEAQLVHNTYNVGVYVTDTDVLIKFMRYGNLVTLRASNYFRPED